MPTHAGALMPFSDSESTTATSFEAFPDVVAIVFAVEGRRGPGRCGLDPGDLRRDQGPVEGARDSAKASAIVDVESALAETDEADGSL